METTETIAAPSPGARALRRALTILMLGGTAVVALHDWAGLGSGFHSTIGGPLYDAVILGAGIACLISGRGAKVSMWPQAAQSA